MKKIIINACFGGFGLSSFAMKKYCEAIGKELFVYKQTKHTFREGVNEYKRIESTDDMFVSHLHNDLGETIDSLEGAEWFHHRDIKRDDSILVGIVEEYGSEKTSGSCASLKVVEIPDDIEWEISEYDGSEEVVESHQSWS